MKIVSDYYDNYKHGLPSEMALLNLFDPATGTPKAVIDATWITDMRTGAVTALGAKYLARKTSRVVVPDTGTSTAWPAVSPDGKKVALAGLRVKKDVREPAIYVGVLAALLLTRVAFTIRDARRRRATAQREAARSS